MHYRLEARRETLHGTFHKSNPAVLRVQDGDTIGFETLEVGWRTERVCPDKPLATIENRDPVLDDGPALTGPVWIEGAQPGMTLEIQMEKLVPGSWGWTSAGGPSTRIPGLGVEGEKASLFWDLDGERGVATNQLGHQVPLKPFLGTVGVASADQEREPGWNPHPRTGGNMDLPLLQVGSSLFLPVETEGALLSVGDAHATQANGEVAGTAIECPLKEARLKVILHRDMAVKSPRVLFQERWATVGVGTTLDAAATLALNAMLDLMEEQTELNRSQALALASSLVDLSITQMVNPLKGVHARLREPLG